MGCPVSYSTARIATHDKDAAPLDNCADVVAQEEYAAPVVEGSVAGVDQHDHAGSSVAVVEVTAQDVIDDSPLVAHVTPVVEYAPQDSVDDDDVAHDAEDDTTQFRRTILEQLLQRAKPEVKAVLRQYNVKVSYLSNRETFKRKKHWELKDSADFLKRMSGENKLLNYKDSGSLVKYIVDQLDLAHKYGAEKCKQHEVSAPKKYKPSISTGVEVPTGVPDKSSASPLSKPGVLLKPALQIYDFRDKFLADTTTSILNTTTSILNKTPIASQSHAPAGALGKNRKSGREIRTDQNKQEREKERKFVAKQLSSREKDITTSLIESAASEDVRNILNLYSVYDEDKSNANKMTYYSRKKLSLQAAYKHILKKDPPLELTKQDLAKIIVSSFNDMLPLHCCKCSELYCPVDQVKTPVKCFKCEAVPHSACINDELQRLDSDRGYVWACYQCLIIPLIVITKSKKWSSADLSIKKVCENKLGSILCQLRNHHAAHSIVQQYSVDLTDSYNARNMEKHDRIMVERAYRSMMNLNSKEIADGEVVKDTIKSMVQQMIQVIKRDFPTSCGTCRGSYTEMNSMPTVRCHACATGGHKGCHTDDLADEEIGVIWLCVGCIAAVVGNAGNLSPIEALQVNPFYCNTEEVSEKDRLADQHNISQRQVLAEENINASNKQQEETSTNSLLSKYLSKEKMSANINPSQRKKADSLSRCPKEEKHTEYGGILESQPKAVVKSGMVSQQQDPVKICPDLLNGICPYGWSGMSGKGCSLPHPKRCHKYCSFGAVEPHGCTKEPCDRFHPKLCLNSVLQKQCFNDDCRRLHLEGTARHRPRSLSSTHCSSSAHVLNTSSRVVSAPSMTQGKLEARKLTKEAAGIQSPPTVPENRRQTHFIPDKPVQQKYYDPISFLVLRLETLKANLGQIQKEMDIVHQRLQEVQKSPRHMKCRLQTTETK